MDTLTSLLLTIAGVFTLTLGTVHFFFPILFDFKNAISKEGPPLKPFRFWPIRYATQRSDVHGLAWVMNHAASYGLVSIGLLDLRWSAWLHQPWATLLCLWIAGWWFLRAGSQLYLGRRRGDWLILTGFAALGVLHIAATLI